MNLDNQMFEDLHCNKSIILHIQTSNKNTGESFKMAHVPVLGYFNTAKIWILVLRYCKTNR